MLYENDKVRELSICYVGGGSRGWAWGFMMDLAMDGQLSGTVRLYDIDHAAAERNRIIGNKISAHPQAKSAWKYVVADTLSEALIGADFVVISILPGTFAEMQSDVHAPEAYGIYQSVGDTIGAGGFMRAMRTVPMFVTIGEAIQRWAPKAWVINYTNPLTLCVRTLYEVFPEVRAFGCCHEVFGTQKLLCAMLESECGVSGVTRQELRTTVSGINHFTWLTSATYQNTDLFPLYRTFAEKYAQTGYTMGKDDNWINSYFESAQRVKFDLFLRYGLIAAAGDRHLAEFMPGWYLRSPGEAADWMFSLTPVSWRVEDLASRMRRSDDLIACRETLTLQSSGEEGHLLLKALLGLGDVVSNVNIPNRGQIPNLPLGAVVETNALLGKDRIQPIYAGPLPGNVLALVSRHVVNQENTLVAAINRDRMLGYTTFMNDPQLTCTPADGQKLFDDMLSGTRACLPKEWF
ncbi:MAG: alpha-glucosidase/alpha-galactosidase [Eubacteriales bacterium]|nr:alpha-glucosidase/alpha-galactosidase [Eubacteriales bacterium]